jgi:ribosomal protein S18 acetylase RimI-like enzyme
MAYLRYGLGCEWYVFWYCDKQEEERRRSSGRQPDRGEERLAVWHAAHQADGPIVTYRDVCTMLETDDFSSIPGFQASDHDMLRSALVEFVRDVDIEHDSGPTLASLSGGSVVELHPFDLARVVELCRQCTDFFELVAGQPGGEATAEEILGPLPGHVTSGTKWVFGIEQRGELLGVVECLEGFRARDEWQVGLLVILPRLRRSGLGTDIWVSAREWISRRGGRLVRLIVQQQNPAARRFWERHGFQVEK